MQASDDDTAFALGHQCVVERYLSNENDRIGPRGLQFHKFNLLSEMTNLAILAGFS